ncbi:unnamed protein product, partial [Symbiodinium microadriaticum]
MQPLKMVALHDKICERTVACFCSADDAPRFVLPGFCAAVASLDAWSRPGSEAIRLAVAMQVDDEKGPVLAKCLAGTSALGTASLAQHYAGSKSAFDEVAHGATVQPVLVSTSSNCPAVARTVTFVLSNRVTEANGSAHIYAALLPFAFVFDDTHAAVINSECVRPLYAALVALRQCTQVRLRQLGSLLLEVVAGEGNVSELLKPKLASASSSTGLGKYLDMKNGGIETPGTKVNVLGRTKLRTQDAFFTFPDPKHENVLTLLNLWHSKPSRVAGERTPRTESNTQPVDEQCTELYAKCVGSSIYLDIDRKDIRFETKELARHMRGPREADWSNLIVLAQYLLHKPDLARVTCLTAESKASGVLTIDGFTDSDWGGCLDTRRSTDWARDIMFIKQLAEEDFRLKL